LSPEQSPSDRRFLVVVGQGFVAVLVGVVVVFFQRLAGFLVLVIAEVAVLGQAVGQNLALDTLEIVPVGLFEVRALEFRIRQIGIGVDVLEIGVGVQAVGVARGHFILHIWRVTDA